MNWCILALDTSTHMATIALYDETGVLFEVVWNAHRDQTVQLLPRIAAALEQNAVSPRDLLGVVVGTGPGSFNGVRVGISAAKGLAMSMAIPIVGVPTLDGLAYQHRHSPVPVWAALEVGRGRLAAAEYRHAGESWCRETGYLNASPEELCYHIKEKALICCEASEAVRERLTAGLGDLAVVASPATSIGRAGYLAEIGWQRLKSGQIDELASLQPIYLAQTGFGGGSVSEGVTRCSSL